MSVLREASPHLVLDAGESKAVQSEGRAIDVERTRAN